MLATVLLSQKRTNKSEKTCVGGWGKTTTGTGNFVPHFLPSRVQRVLVQDLIMGGARGVAARGRKKRIES